jgi:hypothetical protein
VTLATRTIRFGRVTRFKETGDAQDISFERGVNLLSGAPNSGKSVWLQMLDYLLADQAPFGKRFSQAIEFEYARIEAELWLNGQWHTVGRQWWPSDQDETSATLDNRSIGAKGLQQLICRSLDIPRLYFPRGLGTKRQWNELSWRMLMRHVFRQQRFWGDIADRQYADEVTAILLQFLGVAEAQFPSSRLRASQLEKSSTTHLQAVKTLNDVLVYLTGEWIDRPIPDDGIVNAIEREIEKIASKSLELIRTGRSLKAKANANDQLIQIAFERGKLVERRRVLGTLIRLDATMREHVTSVAVSEEELQRISPTRSSRVVTSISAERAAPFLAAINRYLARMNEIRPGTWIKPPVALDVIAGNLVFKVDGAAWNKALGGTEALYFLTAYHFGLMSLSAERHCHYPGLCIIDLPPEFLGESSEQRGKAIIQPFIELLGQPEFLECQVIFSGRALPELAGSTFHAL